MKTSGENAIKHVDWESKFFEKEKEWREKERLYVADLLKQTRELQEALALVEGKHSKKVLIGCILKICTCIKYTILLLMSWLVLQKTERSTYVVKRKKNNWTYIRSKKSAK